MPTQNHNSKATPEVHMIFQPKHRPIKLLTHFYNFWWSLVVVIWNCSNDFKHSRHQLDVPLVKISSTFCVLEDHFSICSELLKNTRSYRVCYLDQLHVVNDCPTYCQSIFAGGLSNQLPVVETNFWLHKIRKRWD